jgi:hypothetical protein
MVSGLTGGVMLMETAWSVVLIAPAAVMLGDDDCPCTATKYSARNSVRAVIVSFVDVKASKQIGSLYGNWEQLCLTWV